MKTIDCKGLLCPKPVILTKKELEAMESGDVEVIVDNDAARENISKLAQSMGLKFEVSQKDSLYHIIIKKEACCSIMNFDNEKKLVILIKSSCLGEGDEKLGSILMKSYLYALSESDKKPNTLIFVNSGVKLTSEGSEVIDTIKNLEGSNVKVLSCGTCLDFYGLKEKLLVGSVSNMYTIVEEMNGADNTITI